MKRIGGAARLRLGLLGGCLLLAACGGGGAADDGPSGGGQSWPLSTLSRDQAPTGERVDVSQRDFFRLEAGNEWVYVRQRYGSPGGVVTRTAGAADAQGWIELSDSEGGSQRVKVTAAGLQIADPLDAETDAPGVYAALPTLRQVATPLYPVDGVYHLERQGDAQLDLDGDGRGESFRVEIDLVFLGFEDQVVLGQTRQVARFRNSVTLLLVFSSDNSRVTAVETELADYADGIGHVRSEVDTTYSADGEVYSTENEVLTLSSATLGGLHLMAEGQYRELPIQVTDMVYDPMHRRYIASQSHTGDGDPQQLAFIDADSGEVSLSRALGGNVGALALTDDVTTLYAVVGDQVVRYLLPSMTESGRFSVPQDLPSVPWIVRGISAAPGRSDLLAVSLRRQNNASDPPQPDGIVLLRDMVADPVVATAIGSTEQLRFDDADPGWLYAYGPSASGQPLSRYLVAADGATLQQSVDSGVLNGRLRVNDGKVVVGDGVFAADASLSALGTLENSTGCLKLPGVGRIACQAQAGGGLRVFDADGLALLAEPSFTAGISNDAYTLAGPAGQLALGDRQKLVLFDSPAFR